MDTTAQVDTLARKMNSEDLTSVIQFINFLIEQRRSKAARDSQQTLMSIQDMFKDDKGWNSEDEMIADMAEFRKQRNRGCMNIYTDKNRFHY
ncbi:MAG: hypothetical protein PUF16_02090 [Lachnospiraceae bacterium]|nr:hypothetical protein [Lachnospiraceae bacterium]